MLNFKSVPFFKLLISFILGILFVFNFGILPKIHLVFFVSLIFLCLSFLFHHFYKPKVYFKKGLYIISIHVFLFVAASQSCFLYQAKNNSNHYSHFVISNTKSFVATITDLPVIKDVYTKLTVEVNCIKDQNYWHYTEGKSIIYIKNDREHNLSIGDEILIDSKFNFISEPKNPGEFDYKTFLEERNIFHSVYANSSQLKIISKKAPNFSLIHLSTQIKSNLVSVLRNSGLSQEAFSICSALLVGYDDEIDGAVMKSFSHSGTLHILSVSGMHTGVLYGILVFLFSLFDKRDQFKKIKFCCIFFFLILFVFITGLSPSVLRAAIMLTLILFGKTFYKQGNSYNTLLLSAFLLLLYNPYLLKDVGFLLSYLAVFGIMYFYPMLSKLYVFENKILQWLWTSVLISIAATLFTLPVSLYNFHQFPIWFAFSNLIIIPISMLIMCFSTLLLVFYKIAIISKLLVAAINWMTAMMLNLASFTDDPQFGYIDFIPFDTVDVVFMSTIIVMTFTVIMTKRYKHVLLLGFAIIGWVCLSIINSIEQKQKNELVVFHVKQKSAFVIRVGTKIFTHLNGLKPSEFERHVKPYLLNISNLETIPMEGNVIAIKNKCIVRADSMDICSKTNPSVILVSHNTQIDLTTNYKTKPIVIADCSNSYKFVKQLKEACKIYNVPFYWVKEQGALQLTL